MINVACFKQRTPDQMDFEDLGKANYNIASLGSSDNAYGMVPEKPQFCGLRYKEMKNPRCHSFWNA
jgi:hypothetical protein